jgi:hypothetical protein
MQLTVSMFPGVGKVEDFRRCSRHFGLSHMVANKAGKTYFAAAHWPTGKKRLKLTKNILPHR